MAITITGIGQTKVLSQLDTYNYTAEQAGLYVVNCQVSMQPVSGMIVTIKVNGSNKLVAPAPNHDQSIIDARVIVNVAQGDTITVVLASSAQQDALRNDFKAILGITPGQVG